MFDFLKRLFAPKSYVYLQMHDGKHKKVRAYKEGFFWYAAPYLPDTTCKLLPKGELIGACYVDSWQPATDDTIVYYISSIDIHLHEVIRKIKR